MPRMTDLFVDRLLCALIVFAVLASATHADDAASSERAISFAHDVRPILSDKCFLCHGPDEGTREAGLRLDTEEGVIDYFGEGDFEAAYAWERINETDPEYQMPPPEHGKPLTPDEVETIRQWMEQGAEWAGHWSFNPPQEIEPPALQDWGSTPIDAFIHARQREANLEPAGPASKEVLIRRLSFDLTGLPPTLEEIDAFVNDNDPKAYERLVDRLLASPHYGERFATVWLDAARYSDTFGYQRDENRFVWPWRDWVIRALNRNQPYDEFVRDQLAGDLIENPTQETRLATTFNRLHGQNSEGGSIPEEFRMEYVADRAQTVSSAMLGLTMECCRCHDHKYDPLSIKDYYSMTAFFDKIDEAGLKSFFTQDSPPPTLRLTTDRQEEQLAEQREAVAAAEKSLQAVRDSEAKKLSDKTPQEIAAPSAYASYDFEDEATGLNKQVEGVRGSAIHLSGDDAITVAKKTQFERSDPFSAAIWLRVDKAHDRAVVFHASRAALDSASRGYELMIEDDRLSAALIHYWPGNAIRVTTTDAVPHDRWVHVAITYDGSSRAEGLRVFVEGRPAETEVIRDKLTRSIIQKDIDQIDVGARFRDNGFAGGRVDDFELYDRQLSAIEVAAIAADERSVTTDDFDEATRLEHHLLTESNAFAAAQKELQARRTALAKTENGLQVIMAMEDSEEPTQSYVRLRGSYDQLGEPVDPKPPSALPQMPEGAEANRLALANWMSQENNPLTARVAANRLWQAVFGEGLVRTPEDFGAQGVPPTHPYLLDYLANSFVESGWDQKALIKQMVMSDAYQQSTIGSQASYEKDPENKLLARAPRRRWPAEMLRDNALAASGLLVNKIGGKPVKPYEVAASFKPTTPDKGEGLYRRSLYTFFKRSAPAPIMTAFDAPDRSVCRVKRERTQSPMQALVLLNGPQFVEAARVLAEEAVRQHGDDKKATIERIFRQLTSQRPNEQETGVLLELLNGQSKRFAERPEQADELLGVGDRPAAGGLDRSQVAATTVLAQAIMSCDKCVTRQ